MILSKNNKKSSFDGVGADIGNYSIKVAGIKKRLLSKKPELSFGIEQVPKDATFEQRAKLLRKAMADAGIFTTKINISVCGPNVMYKYIRFPPMSNYELQDTIELEWDRYISLKKEDVNWDYTVLDTIKDPAGKYMQVLVVAVKNDFIEERINLLKLAGLEPKLVDIDSLALVTAFKFIHPEKNNKPIIILNFGEYFTNQAILKKGACWFFRDINIGSHDITGIISEKLNLSFPEAEQLKCELGSNKNSDACKLINSFLDNLVNEIKLSLEYLRKELEDEVGSVYIFGAGSHLYRLEEILAQNLGVPVIKWDIANSFDLGPRLSRQALIKYSLDLGVAIGLALTKEK